MDDAKSCPSYEERPPLADEDAPPPSYREITGAQTVLTFDPTGTLIKPLSKDGTNGPALYSLSTSLLNVKTKDSIQVKRLESKPSSTKTHETTSTTVYGIGELYIEPLLSRQPLLKYIQVSRSHGIYAASLPKKREWNFVTRVPLKKGEGMDGFRAGGEVGPNDPVFLIGVGNGPGTVQKPLLQLIGGKWFCYITNDDGEVIAIESEGVQESNGMPVLTLSKDLDLELMDFLVSAWCVTMWGGHVKKHAGRLNILLGG